MSRAKVKVTGVYTITNTKNGKVYIGSSGGHIPERWRQHQYLLRKGTHHSAHLQGAWNKYGGDAFVFEVLELCAPDECASLEQYWGNQLRVFERAFGYNISVVCFSNRGLRLSDEVKRAIGIRSAARKLSPEHIAALAAGRARMIETYGHPLAGKPLTPEHKAKISAANKGRATSTGRKATPEASANMSKARKGVPLSEAHKKALSLARKGTPMSEAAKEKMRGRKLSAAHVDKLRGRPVTQETRDRISAANAGRIPSSETKAKMSTAIRASWVERRAKGVGIQKT
jgi:group I intron endonuclease